MKFDTANIHWLLWAKKKESRKVLEISARLIKELQDLCQGIHIMSLGWEQHIPAVLEMTGL